jgi:arylsulfatase A-like enzyme
MIQNPSKTLRAAALTAMAATAGLASTAPAAETPPRQPNVVLLLIDDLGYADLGIQGQAKDVRTPNIDSIGRNGVRFTNGYVSCPVCSPTRAGLLTGRYQQRFGHEFNPGPAVPANFGLPKDQATLADAMKKAGYATGIIGKWHLGESAGQRPLDRGFDEFYGFLGGAHQFVHNAQPDPQRGIFRADKVVAEDDYLTDAIAREAVDYIQRHKDKPFFEYVAFNEVHMPQQATQKYLDRFPDEKDPTRRQLLAKLSAADDAVGKVLATLRENHLEENTLIFLLSDNGGPTAQNGSSNAPFSGFKSQLLEGGIRVPFMVQWTSHLPAGKVLDQPVISLDVFPTALAAAGAAPAANIDGKDLLPLLRGQTDKPPHESLYWRFGAQWAVREGDLKFLHSPQGQDFLFDLKADPAERHDLSQSRAADLKRLREHYGEWNGTLAAPLWNDRSERQAQRGNRRDASRRDAYPATQSATQPQNDD